MFSFNLFLIYRVVFMNRPKKNFKLDLKLWGKNLNTSDLDQLVLNILDLQTGIKAPQTPQAPYNSLESVSIQY